MHCFSQKHIEKSISSEAEQVILEFNVIDQIQLFNSQDDTNFLVLAEGKTDFPIFSIKEVNGVVYVEENEIIAEPETDGLGKVCIPEPNFTSYQIYIPKGKGVYVSFIEGNFYADDFRGDLNLIVENGIIKLNHINDSVKARLNSGSIFVQNIENAFVDAETSLGSLIADSSLKGFSEDEKHLVEKIGNTSKKLLIRTILANIYLNVSKD